MARDADGLTWERPQDERLFEDLVAEVRGGRCCAFIGAGLSRPAGYPDWTGLLDELACEAGLAPNAFSSEDYLERADECFAALGETGYRAFLARTFSAKGKEPFRAVHQCLIRTPFNAYLTTNFDGCLEAAAEMIGGNGRIHIFPDLNPADLREGTIFHIHGKLHHEGGMNPVGSILLRKADYKIAYQDNSAIRMVLQAAFAYNTILFVGYSLSDPDLLQILETVERERAVMSGVVQDRGLGQMRPNRHFAVLPRRLKEVKDDLGHIQSKLDEEEERVEERRFARAGVAVLRYVPDKSSHHRLTEILQVLQRLTQLTPTVPLEPQWDVLLPRKASVE